MNRTLATAALAALPASALAQPFSIPWFSIDCGGQTAPITGGPFTLAGTIGQPDAGDAPGQPFSCTSGFWAAAAGGAVCYPNCDSSTTPPTLNVSDFACFLNRFQAGDPYANCDGSTTPPVLNVADFACFLNRFNTGCG
jgi:hypothetical protein